MNRAGILYDACFDEIVTPSFLRLMMITALAPAFATFLILVATEQLPCLIKAILFESDCGGRREHARINP
jgi:hypothetical protein